MDNIEGLNNEAEHPSKRLIDGRHIIAKDAIARCHSIIHPGYLSKKLIKSHKCLEKDCSSFEKTNLQYWQNIELQKEKIKNERKEKQKQKKELQISQENKKLLIRRILEENGSIHVTAVNENSAKLLTISYIYDGYVNLDKEVQILKKQLGQNIRLRPHKTTENIIERTIRKHRYKKEQSELEKEALKTVVKILKDSDINLEELDGTLPNYTNDVINYKESIIVVNGISISFESIISFQRKRDNEIIEKLKFVMEQFRGDFEKLKYEIKKDEYGGFILYHNFEGLINDDNMKIHKKFSDLIINQLYENDFFNFDIIYDTDELNDESLFQKSIETLIIDKREGVN